MFTNSSTPHYQERDSCEYEVVKPESLDWFDPVRMATITCSFGMDEGVGHCESIKWTYNSSNTILENAISACGLNLGLNEDGGIAHVLTNTKALDGSVNSLVEASVILGNKKEQYQGIWVDRDLTITILQALICAAKQWLGEEVCRGELNLLIYVNACKSISQLRQKIYSIGEKFQQFEFIDCERQDEYQETFSNDNNFDKLRFSLHEIAKNARSELKKIPKTQAYFLLRCNLYRCYFIAKLMLLRFENFQGNISNVKQLIIEIENVLEEDNAVKAQLNPIQALLQTERILYELSVGSVPVIDDSKRYLWLKLEQWREKIHVAIKPETVYKDPGLDVYHALSEIYGNCARVEFYLSDNPDVLENTADNFLRAAHYALRIGYKQRASRWFALAGRVWVRLNNEELSKQALNLAKKLAFANLTSWHDFSFSQAVCSEISLLEGEILLIIQNKPTHALECFLKALKGAIYLRLNRRMCDALVNISRCSKQLGDRTIKNDLSLIFFNTSDKIFEQSDNYSTEKVIKFIYSLWQREDNVRWLSVSKNFSDAAAQIWQDWHDIYKPQSDNIQHPIAEKIKNGTLYIQVNKSASY